MTRARVETGRLHLEPLPRERTGARRDEVYLFTGMAVMIDGIAQESQRRRRSGVDFIRC